MSKNLIILSIAGVVTAVIAAYIIYRLGWNGGNGGNSTVDNSTPVIPSGAFGYKPTGGYIPGRNPQNVSYN